MDFRSKLPLALTTAAALALGLAACGDDDNASSTVVERTTVTRTVTAPATAAQTTTAPPATSTGTGTTTTPAGPLTLRAAEQVLDGRGYATLSERDWRPDQTLKVLVGVRRGTSDGGQQQAFFFAGDRWIGTDASAPSGRITVVDQQDDAITLAYALYRPGDSIESPSGGERQVTFAWDGSRLTPQQPIPPAAADAQLSRR